MKHFYISIFFFCFVTSLCAQKIDVDSLDSSKGTIFLSWGWNSGWYTDSDIHFTSDSYDFILSDVVATDRQTPFGLDPYFHPAKITIPQTNFRLGYFFRDRWNISLGFDHMKYVLKQDQFVSISGEINTGNTFYDGTYQDEQIQLSGDFIQYEHTDGLNYINVEIRRIHQLTNNNFLNINAITGMGIGFLMPRTRTYLLGNFNRDAYKLSGYGLAPLVGLNLEIGKWFFLQSEYKMGYISMPGVRISNSGNGNASQSFFFRQWNYVFGFSKRF